jgi:superfamily II DNA or RNA helicase
MESVSLKRAYPFDGESASSSGKRKAVAKAEAFVEAIKKKLVPIKDTGMTVLYNVPMLEGPATAVSHVVIRGITEPFWKACLKVVNADGNHYRVCAVGSPGIGKTTCTTVLIRMLLKRKKTVVYLVREPEKGGWYYEFIPMPEGPIFVNVYPEDERR